MSRCGKIKTVGILASVDTWRHHAMIQYDFYLVIDDFDPFPFFFSQTSWDIVDTDIGLVKEGAVFR